MSYKREDNFIIREAESVIENYIRQTGERHPRLTDRRIKLYRSLAGFGIVFLMAAAAYGLIILFTEIF